MPDSTAATSAPASPDLRALVDWLRPQLQRLADQVQQFRRQPPTPPLAERVGRWAAEHGQAQVQTLLRQEHGVAWSVKSLRKVTAALRDGLAPFRAPAQAAKLLGLLEAAFATRGRRRPVLAAGR